ncbi:MAG: hypothetical protein M1353_06470 [Nitrospirae bacterium]|nr:hypothetical protein [Nitrospirota bacterium]
MNKYTPECPFCGRPIARPAVTQTEFGEILSGKCACGTVYVCDPTGHNIGEAYMEALALLRGDWDIAALDSDTDYRMFEMDYDLKSHTRIYSKGLSNAAGKLLLIKSKHGDTAQTITDKKSERDKAGKANLKGSVKRLLEAGSYDELVNMAKQDKSVISRLISLSYDKEDAISWRSMEALGLISRELSGERMDVVRDTIRRLLWSMGDESGGIGWSAAEILGEIIRNGPDEFRDIIPILWSFREEDMFRAGTAWAVGRIAGVRPDLVRFALNDLKLLLDDNNPAVRGYAVWAIGMLGDEKDIESIKSLSDDKSRMNFYKDGALVKTAVGEVAKEVLYKRANR